MSVRRPLRYATSFFGVVDLLAIIPTYVSIFVPGSQYLLVIRILRLLRIFRLLKLAEYLTEADTLRRALRASRRKISVFLSAVLLVPPENGVRPIKAPLFTVLFLLLFILA